MANIASVLKSEIARLARKEVRTGIELEKGQRAHRSAIASLRREVESLQKALRNV